MKNSVCAVVVTYRPTLEDLGNLKPIRGQAQALVVVDNGSSQESLALLRSESTEQNFFLIENGENLGIAEALNRGVAWAQRHSYQWVVLFDQDSGVTDGFIDEMVKIYEIHPDRARIGILAPVYIDRRLNIELPAAYASDGTLEYAMTSGNLMPTSIFKDVGPFESQLFIGGVDFEYCLRLRSLGYLVQECKTAKLLHSPASPTAHCFAGKWNFTTSNYSPARRYYRERNIFWMLRRYGAKFPLFFFSLYKINVKEWIKVILAEKEKFRKSYFILLGLRDGILGRMGKGAAI